MYCFPSYLNDMIIIGVWQYMTTTNSTATKVTVHGNEMQTTGQMGLTYSRDQREE